MSGALPRSFFARHSPVVARDLIGLELVATAPGAGQPAVRSVIVEVEAYDQSDPAAHTFNGPTPRNEVMFGPPGHLYTYFTYGMHWCANIVTGPEGHGEAVLLRAARLLQGIETVRRRRGESVSDRDLLRGPARLTQALGLDRDANGMDLVAPTALLRLQRGEVGSPAVATGPRVGIRLAADVPWRFFIPGDRYVSAYRRHPKAATPRPLPQGLSPGRRTA